MQRTKVKLKVIQLFNHDPTLYTRLLNTVIAQRMTEALFNKYGEVNSEFRDQARQIGLTLKKDNEVTCRFQTSVVEMTSEFRHFEWPY